MAIHFHPLTVTNIRKETPECVSIAFQVPDEWKEVFRFLPGQNITLRTQLNGKEVRRNYSICSSPSEKELRVAVKRIPQGVFSHYANHVLKSGDALDVLPPSGNFFWKGKPGSYLAFAAGSGITPVISMAKAALETPGTFFTLVYGNRNRQSIIFREALEALKNQYMERFQLIHVLSREKSDIPLASGRIDEEKCRFLFQKLIHPLKMDGIFICGPEPMIQGVNRALEEAGVSPAIIHFERFQTPGTAVSAPASISSAPVNEGKHSKVNIILDGNHFSFELPWDGAAVLDAALAAGADLPYACKGGVCCTCRARLESGEVEMDANYALEEEELKAGYILTCQSHPRSKEILINFDAR